MSLPCWSVWEGNVWRVSVMLTYSRNIMLVFVIRLSYIMFIYRIILYMLDFVDQSIKRTAKKISIQYQIHHTTLPRKKEIWLTYLGHNIGHEENGKWEYLRPVLVIKNAWSMLLSIPMSTKSKPSFRNIPCNFHDVQWFILVNHIRSLDSKRFIKCLGLIDTPTFCSTKKLLGNILSIS